MRLTILSVLFTLFTFTAIAQDSVQMRIMVRLPVYGPPAKNASVKLDGRPAVLNSQTFNYELNVPANKLVEVEIEMEKAQPLKLKYFTRQWKHSNELLYVALGDKGCRYIRSFNNKVMPSRPDTLRIGIVLEKDTEQRIPHLADSLSLVKDSLWQIRRFPPGNDRTFYPYAVYRKKDGMAFNSSDDVLKLLRQKGYKAGVFFDLPQGGLSLASPLTVSVHRDVKVADAKKVFSEIGLKEESYDNVSQFMLSVPDEGLGLGTIDLINKLMDTGIFETITSPGYSGYSLFD